MNDPLQTAFPATADLPDPNRSALLRLLVGSSPSTSGTLALLSAAPALSSGGHP